MSIPFTWIYLVCDPYTGLFKIGKSDDPHARLKQLCSISNGATIPAAPQEYVLVEAWLCRPEEESNLHRRYAAQRVRGEWFNFDEHGVSDVHRHMRRHQRLIENEYTWSEEAFIEAIEALEVELARVEAENDILRVYTGRRLANKPVLLLNAQQEVVVA